MRKVGNKFKLKAEVPPNTFAKFIELFLSQVWHQAHCDNCFCLTFRSIQGPECGMFSIRCVLNNSFLLGSYSLVLINHNDVGFNCSYLIELYPLV